MILALLACSTSAPIPERPASVPDELPALRFVNEDIQVDGTRKLGWRDLSSGFGSVAELETDLADGAWMAIPSTARWFDVQRLLASSLPTGPVYMGDLESSDVVGPLERGMRGEVIVTCQDGPLKVVGAHPRLNLEIHADDLQAWVDASVRFMPVVEKDGKQVVANLFQDECWAPQACDRLGEAAAACTEGGDPVENVRVAGPVGCFLPLGKGFRGHESWRTELPVVLGTLGFGPDADVLVTATEQVPYGAVLSVLHGLQNAQIKPQIALSPMGSRAGPPMCNIPTRDAAQLAEAGQAWYGRYNAKVGANSQP